MSTEEKIKQAFELQADRTGDHRRVLSEVAKRTSSRRRVGPIGITLITAGVAAAVVTPVVLFSGGSQPTTSGPANSPTASASAAREPEQAPAGTVRMKYQPTWVPTGVTETGRFADPGNNQFMRLWQPPGANQETKASLTQYDESKFPAGSGAGPDNVKSVDINGTPGTLRVNDAPKAGVQAIVSWLAAPNERLVVEVDFLPDAENIALRMAKSVRPDGDAAFVRTVEFGWLPPKMRQGGWMVNGTSPTDYSILADTELAPEARGGKRVSVQIDKDTPAEAKSGQPTPVTVRGKQGVHIAGSGSYGEVWVQLDGGKWLEVSGPLTKADLVKVADDLKIAPTPSFPWLGRR